MDLASLFAVHTPPLELVVRGTLMYWFLLLVFRFVLRRDGGTLGVADLLFIAIVADASQNAMAGAYNTVAEGLILVSTLVFWNYAIDWAAFHWKFARRLTEAPPLLLIKDGRVMAGNMRREFITRDDLEGELRKAGIDDLACVRKAYMESDGRFSVLTTDGPPRASSPREDSGVH